MSLKETLRKLFNPTDEEKKAARKSRLEDLHFQKEEARLQAQLNKYKPKDKKETWI